MREVKKRKEREEKDGRYQIYRNWMRRRDDMRKDGENGRKSDRRGRIRKKYRSGENK